MKKVTASLYVAALLLSTSLTPAAIVSANEPLPTLSSAESNSTNQFPREIIQWKVSKIKAKDVTSLNLQTCADYIKTPGNHLVIYGMDLNEKAELLQPLFKSDKNLFRFDLMSLVSKDQGGNQKDSVILPTYLSIANVNGFMQFSYGTVIINPLDSNSDTLQSKLKKKSFEARKTLDDQIDYETDTFINGYENERQEFLLHASTPPNQGTIPPMLQRIRTNKTYYYDNGSSFSLAGKIEGTWLINQEAATAQDITYSIQGNLRVQDADSAVYNGLCIDQFRSALSTVHEEDQLISGQPVAKDQLLEKVQGGTQDTVSLLDAQATTGSKGHYNLFLHAKQYDETLPRVFHIQFATTVSSKRPQTVLELQQWFRSVSIRTNSTEFFSVNELLRND